MRRFATLSLAPLLAATLLVGCQGVNLPLTGAGARYGQLNFTPASQDSLSRLSSSKGAEGQASAPMAPTAGADLAVGAPAPSMVAPMPYYYGGYWGNEYELVSTTEAKTGGFQGDYQQTLDSVVKPLVADWATDAVLRNVSGLTDTAGVNLKPSPQSSASDSPAVDAGRPVATDVGMTMPAMMPYYQPESGWRFEFASRGKRESLHFFVTAASTLVVKQAYRERVQDLSGAKLNSAEVIAIVSKAIQDKSIQANDPAMPTGMAGGSSGSGVAIAVPVAAVPPMKTAQTNPSTPVSSGPAPDAPPPPIRPAMPAEEELTTVPPNARWDLSLYLEPLPNQTKPDGTNPTPAQTRLVWNVSMQQDYSAQQQPGVGFSPAWARVDANTGALLSLNRPRKYTYPTEPTSYPKPMPAASSGSAEAGTATSAGGAPTPAAK
jgi:hypothetical protein